MATITTPPGYEKTRFKEILAGNVSSQNHKQRFPYANGGSPSSPGMSFNDDSDDDEPHIPQGPADPHQPPRIAEWRSNLVALSQIDNLYFAVYQDKIHVTIPRSLKQTIHGKPDLIIDLPRSDEGLRVGGYLDRTNPHCANHIIVGNLGSLEIVLVCCDDGDAIGYYTHHIQAAIKSPGNHLSIRPFFHENVGISAWGLAVHAESRMIAVSSNNREVTVFSYGCRTTGLSEYQEEYSEELWLSYSEFESLFGDESRQMELPSGKATLFPAMTQAGLTNSSCSFRRVLKLGPEGNNIPSIDFSSDSSGKAHSILATDIAGNLWILSIWGMEEERERIPSIHKQRTGHNPMGWGALVIPLAAFKRLETPEEALGVPGGNLDEVVSGAQLGIQLECHFDITATVLKVADSTPYHPLFGYGAGGAGTTPDPVQTTPDPSTGLGSFSTAERFLNQDVRLNIYPPPALLDRKRKFFERLINKPLKKIDVDREVKIAQLKRLTEFENPMQESAKLELTTIMEGELSEPESEPMPENPEPPVYYLQDKCAILRTYQDDIELIPPTETMARTICRKVLKQLLPVAIAHQVHFERLIFQALIVELGLVVVGSQVGRVALLSLTRPEDSFSQLGPITMFRIDRILPTKRHEVEGFRPSVPLLGIAVSPLQGQQMKERKRWRLIMHYYDHSILSYELSREGNDLLVL